MNDIERIYSLLLHSNGLKIRAISQELELDKYHVAEIMFSSQNNSYWYQDDDSLWYAKEGALQIEEPEEEIDELLAPVEIPQRFNFDRFLEEDLSDSLRSYLSKISKYRIYSNDEMIELFKRYRNGDQKAFDLIIKSQQRLVANIAPVIHSQLEQPSNVPERVDFQLKKVSGQENHTMLMLGDIHLANRTNDRNQFKAFVNDINAIYGKITSEPIRFIP